jgi:hypothetical protein
MSNNIILSRYKYNCEFCNYYTCKKTNYERHLLTSKHNKFTNIDNIEQKKYKCDCGKKYGYRQSLYLHKKKCKYEKEEKIKCEIINDTDNKDKLEKLIFKLVEENNEFKEIIKKQQDQISELIPKVGNTNNTTNNNTTNNNKFNINVFLNEKCKDAISINEFVSKIEISLKNLLTTKSKGIGIGINEIINENMNKLSVYERPIHCTDKKRETLYIKNDTWTKDVDKTHTTSMLKALQSQQFKAMRKWQEAHPNYNNDEDLKHEYIILVNKCSSSLNDHEKKLFKNICENNYIKDELQEI